MHSKTKFTSCILLCLSILLSYACVQSSVYFSKKEQGSYIDTTDFPNTKWVCRELNMYFYMFDYSESYMIGNYIVNGKSYRVIGNFEFEQLNFNFYSSTQMTKSENGSSDTNESFIQYERNLCGNIYTDHLYENEILICTVRNFQSVDGESIPTTLTFDKTQNIELSRVARWHAQELDMYLDSFDGMSEYFQGEIVIDGKKHFVHALEMDNNNFFMLSIENGITNNLISRTTSPLVYMYFEIYEDRIIATISDDIILNPESFPYWNFEESSITFYKE